MSAKRASTARGATSRKVSSSGILLLLALALALTGCQKKKLDDFGPVPSFALTDQAGAPFTSDSLRGKVWAAAFVFTRCPMACPRVTRAMRRVQEDAARRKVALFLVSFSVDPDNDTPAVLRSYAREYGADLASWSFVTGDATVVRTTAEQGFKIAVEGTADPRRADFGITHGTQLVLVDGALHIRGFYATDDEAALARVVTDAAQIAK